MNIQPNQILPLPRDIVVSIMQQLPKNPRHFKSLLLVSKLWNRFVYEALPGWLERHQISEFNFTLPSWAKQSVYLLGSELNFAKIHMPYLKTATLYGVYTAEHLDSIFRICTQLGSLRIVLKENSYTQTLSPPTTLHSLYLSGCTTLINQLVQNTPNLRTLLLGGNYVQQIPLTAYPAFLQKLQVHRSTLLSIPLPSTLVDLQLYSIKKNETLPEFPQSIKRLELLFNNESELPWDAIRNGLPGQLEHFKLYLKPSKGYFDACNTMPASLKTYVLSLFESKDSDLLQPATAVRLQRPIKHFSVPQTVNSLEVFDFLSKKSIPQFEWIRELTLRNSHFVQTLMLPPNLVELNLFGCEKLQSYSTLPKSLLKFKVRYCEKLKIDRFFPSCLKALTFEKCVLPESLTFPDALRTLQITDCFSLMKIERLDNTRLKRVELNQESLRKLPLLPRTLRILILICNITIELQRPLPKHSETFCQRGCVNIRIIRVDN